MNILKRIIIYWLLVAVAAIYVGPFLWVISTSFKTASEATENPPRWVPVSPEFRASTQPLATKLPDEIGRRAGIIKDNYCDRVMNDPSFDFALYTRNTLIIALLSTLGATISSSLVAYALARLHWRGKNLVFGIVLGTMMLPFTVVMVPQYDLFRELGWIGSNLPLWVPAFFGVPFFIFLLRQFYMTIPNELADAARIDGCSEFRIWWQIVLPLSRPALAVVALFAFMGAWRDFLGPLIYLSHRRDFTLALALQFFQSRSGGTSWELLMAATLLVIAPIIVLFFMAQKTFIQGIATTGMKG